MKLQEALAYFNNDHNAGYKKRTSFKGCNSYTQNRSYEQYLIDADFIPFPKADSNNVIDIVDNDHSVFTPDIINSTTDKFGENDE